MVEAVKVSELVKDLPSLRVVEGKAYLDQKLINTSDIDDHHYLDN